MARTQRLFIYKCVKGHVTKKTFPLGTRFDTNDETTCLECLKANEVKPAYLVYAHCMTVKEPRDG